MVPSGAKDPFWKSRARVLTAAIARVCSSPMSRSDRLANVLDVSMVSAGPIHHVAADGRRYPLDDSRGKLAQGDGAQTRDGVLQTGFRA